MHRHPASFRDPDGHVFSQEGKIYRLIQASYFPTYDHFQQSGLYNELVNKGFLIPHTLISRTASQMVIKPEPIPFISYAPEWSFTMLKEAALLHLHINSIALQHGMILKDASGYNVQFIGTKAVFIDTLSFTPYQTDTPWYAFGKFCCNFIAPLLLLKYNSVHLHKLLVCFLDGIPLELASRLLPFRTRFQPFIQFTIHHHAAKIDRYKTKKKNPTLSKKHLLHLLRYTELYLEKLQAPAHKTEWQDYYSCTNYSSAAFAEKKQIVARWVNEIEAAKIWDVSGNNGYFSRQIATLKNFIISSDIDPIASDNSFQQNKKQGKNNILSLLLDLTNPTPSYGFVNQERTAFLQRIKELDLDCCLVLALIHHLCITHNCSFKMLAAMFAPVTRWLIIEFVDRQDSNVEKLLSHMRTNRSTFDFYTAENFITEFKLFFQIVQSKKITGTNRTLYLLKSHPE